MSGKILIVGTQGREVSSGPGTFMRYLSEGIKNGSLKAEILYPHSKKDTPHGDETYVHCSDFAELFYLRFPGSWVVTAFFLWVKLKFGSFSKAYDVIWFADRYSAAFCALDPFLCKRVIVMVNDDTRIFSYQELFSESLISRFNPGSMSRRMFYFLERCICRRSLGVVSNSNYLSQLLESHYGVKGNVFRLYKAVDLDAFKARNRRDPKMQVGHKSVLFLKNEWRRGGLDTLIEALALRGVDDLSLKIAGMDLRTERPKIEGIIREKGYSGKVEFIGRVERGRIPELMAGSDIFCVPSRIEALGVAFLEALAAGVSVIGTNTGGIPEVLAQGEVGWLVPVNDSKSLGDAIMEVVTAEDLVKCKRDLGFQHVLKFSTDCMFRGIIDISNCLKNKNE